MSTVPFDCSQFITVSTNLEKIKKEQIKRNFMNRGFNIKINNEIDNQKLSYFSDEFLETTIEIVEQEFIGEFEEWYNVSIIPSIIKNFSDATEELVNLIGAEEYKIILVNYVCSDPSENRIERKTFVKKDLIKTLFYASFHNFELYGNVYIFSHKL